MSNIIAAIKLRELDISTIDDIQILSLHNSQKQQAEKLINSMAIAAGGRVVGDHESDIVIELPIDQAEVVRDIHTRLAEDLDMSTSIGVGDDIEEAKKALNWAKEHRPGTIKVIDPVVERSDIDSNNDSRSQINQESIAIDQSGRPEQINKAEPKDPVADDSEPISDEMKQKIANIVAQLKNSQQSLDKLKETSPEAYSAVVSVVQSITAMTQKAKEAGANKHAKLITKVAKFLEQSESRALDEESAKVLEYLIEEQKRAQEEKEYIEKLKMKAVIEQQKRQAEKAEMQKRHSMVIHTRDNDAELFDDGYDEFGYRRVNG